MTRREPVAWVLNLDAEDELLHGSVHTPSAAVIARIEALLATGAPDRSTAGAPGLSEPVEDRPTKKPAPGLSEPVEDRPALRGLLLPDDELVFPRRGGALTVREGRAWCPTRWAREQLEKAGLPPLRAPSPAILRRVNHRRFSHELGQALPLAGYATTRAEFDALISRSVADVSLEAQWLIKRPLGYAGRGRKKWRVGAETAEERAWLAASLREGEGVQVEPLVQRELDVALHGELDERGHCAWGRPTVQELDPTGAWRRSRLARPDELTASEHEALLLEGERTARALHAAGYFGPFGIDAFRWVDAGGARHFQPRCEINARYSMGWATGFGG